MAETVIMPKLGFDMAEGTLVRWVIQEGEPVSKGAVLAEIETDKATVEVEFELRRHRCPPSGQIRGYRSDQYCHRNHRRPWRKNRRTAR